MKKAFPDTAEVLYVTGNYEYYEPNLELFDEMQKLLSQVTTGLILFAGDTHGSFGHIIEVVRNQRPAAVVFLGDLQPEQPLEQELQPILDLTDIWWIDGNHDTDTEQRTASRSITFQHLTSS